jgi:hypothetical protein
MKMSLERTSAEISLRLAHIWWAGFKVLCRWGAFSLVLWVFWIPVAGLTYLIEDRVNHGLSTVLMILIAPIPFYLTSKYLLLLGDKHPTPAEAEPGPTDAGEQSKHALRRRIAISTAAAFASFAFFTPPDPLSMLIFGSATALLCGATLLILAQFHFLKSSSRSMQIVICAIVCLAAITSIVLLQFLPKLFGR